MLEYLSGQTADLLKGRWETYTEGLIQGSINVGDVSDAECNSVRIHAVVLEGQLLCIPHYPAEATTFSYTIQIMLCELISIQGRFEDFWILVKEL